MTDLCDLRVKTALHWVHEKLLAAGWPAQAPFWVALLAAIGCNIHAVACLVSRAQYERAIHEARAIDRSRGQERLSGLTKAFCAAPERIEAQALLEELFWLARSSDQRELVRQFVSDPEVQVTVGRLRRPVRWFEGIPFGHSCVGEARSRSLDDPITWYLSLLPEASDYGERSLIKICLAMIPKDYPTLDQSILRITLEAELITNPSASSVEWQNIGNQLKDLELKLPARSVGPFYEEVLWDRLAQWHLSAARDSDLTMNDAIGYFAQLMNHRQSQMVETVTTAPVLRPPEKLLVFAFFDYESKALNAPPGALAEVARYYQRYPQMRKNFQQKVFNVYGAKFGSDRINWLKGTCEDPEFSNAIDKFLDEGWRF
jgi:hypothetical protein